jgi:putative PIN family toxin of toxin-antitoxin system
MFPPACDPGPGPARVVLDSNVWIDILIFDDPRARPIRAALECGALHAVIDSRCLAELLYVLDYPQFARFERERAGAAAAVARLAEQVENPAPAPSTAVRSLPACSDQDDQKFLELAQGAQACWLVTKDRALLKMARRIARDFGFQIGDPVRFVATFQAICAAASAASDSTRQPPPAA